MLVARGQLLLRGSTRLLSTSPLHLLQTYSANLQTARDFLSANRKLDSSTTQVLDEVQLLVKSFAAQPDTFTADKQQELEIVMRNCELLFNTGIREAAEVQQRRKKVEECFVVLHSVRKLLKPKLHPEVVSDLQQAEQLMETFYGAPDRMGKQEEASLREITADLQLLLNHLESEQKQTEAGLLAECRDRLSKVRALLESKALFDEEMQLAFKEAERELESEESGEKKLASMRSMIAGLDMLCEQHGGGVKA